MRYLGLDYGQKRIGVALSDPLGMTAQPIPAIPMNAKAYAAIAELVAKNDVNEIVLGYPRSLSGEKNAMCREVETFAEQLKKQTPVPIRLWDERLTTAQSESLLVHANVRRAKRKQVRDTMAAVLILQNFLDANSSA